MKKKVFFSFWVLLTIGVATTVFTSCEKDNDEKPNTYDAGVVINGVKWATCNVGALGSFAAKPEAYGNLRGRIKFINFTR